MGAPICHVEIPAKNVGRARKFYAGCFGWTFKAVSPRYATFSWGDQPSGAIVKTEKVAEDGAATIYLQVESTRETLRLVKELKLPVLMKRTDLGGGNGFIAQFRDTEGNRVGIYSEA